MMILLNLCTGLPPATPPIRSVRPHRPSHNDGLPRHVCLRVRRPAHRLCRSRRRRALPTTTGCGTTPAGFAPTICAASINSVVTGTSDYIKTFSEAMDTIKTVIWNGPMGVVEFEKFAAVLKFNLYSRSTQIKSGSWTDVRKIEGRTSSGRTRRPRASPSSGLPPRSLVGANGRGGGRESFGAY